jgi:hypothetical protein
MVDLTLQARAWGEWRIDSSAKKHTSGLARASMHFGFWILDPKLNVARSEELEARRQNLENRCPSPDSSLLTPGF